MRLEGLLDLWIYLINVEAEYKAEMYSAFVADILLAFNGREWKNAYVLKSPWMVLRDTFLLPFS